MTFNYCEKCGRALVKGKLSRYNGVTGKALYWAICPSSLWEKFFSPYHTDSISFWEDKK